MNRGDNSERKVNILYVIPRLIVGGAERQLVELLKHLNRSRFNPVLVCIGERTEGKFEEDLKLSNVPIYHFGRMWRWDMTVLLKMLRWIKSKDIAIIHFWEMMSGFYSLIPGKILRTPIINSSIRDANPAVSYRSILKRFLFLFSDVIVANSKAGLRNYSISSPRGRVVYNGVDLNRFVNPTPPEIIRQRLKISKNEKIVGVVANLTSKKDYYTFFKGCELVSKKVRNVRFVAVGDGLERDKYLDFARRLGILEKILYLGQRADVVDLINTFDVGVLCSYPETGEGVSNSILEYMASGKPVVATDVGGTKEVVIAGVTGFLVPAKKPVVLAKKVVQLLEDKYLAKKMGLAGRKRVEKVFPLENMVQNIEKIYREALGGN